MERLRDVAPTDHSGQERALVDQIAGDGESLLDEDVRHGSQVRPCVVPATADLGHPLQHVDPVLLRVPRTRKSHACVGDLTGHRNQVGIGRVPPIGEQDDVPQALRCPA